MKWVTRLIEKLSVFLSGKVLLWTSLRSIRNVQASSIFSSLVIVIPMATMLKLDELLQFGTSDSQIILYFSALFFYFGCLLFDQLSPRVIREFETRFKFSEEWMTHQTKRNDFVKKVRDEVESILAKNLHDLEDIAAGTSEARNVSKIETAMIAVAGLESQAFGVELIDNIWSDKNSETPIRRCLVQLSFFISGLFLTYITFYVAPFRVIQAFLM
jgi:hypothetical protein